MVLLSDGCSGEIYIPLPLLNKVLFVHHDINSPVVRPLTQFCPNLCPSCRSVNTLIEYKSFLATNCK